MVNKIELLAPAGNWSMLTAAIDAGADAVYFGIAGFNMRVAAQNFSIEEMPKLISYCHERKVKVYCTVNIIIFEQELPSLDDLLAALKTAGVDAVICWDLAVIKKCRELGLSIHLSTQASVSNSSSANLWKELGVTRIVLARECSLRDVAEISKNTGLEIEVFVHGARCISLSGRCFMSYELFGKSANRGECLQPCRREYKITDEENKEMKLENNYIMSAKDLCVLPFLPKLVELGISSYKIEGRNRGAEYVFKVVSAYRKALIAIENKTFSEELSNQLIEQLREVYNKDYSTGFYVNYPHHERTNVHNSKATTEKVQIGKVSNFYPQKSVVEFKIESSEISMGEKLAFIGSTTGYYKEEITEMHDENGSIETAKQSTLVAVKLKQKVRENDKVFVIRKVAGEKKK